MSTSSTTTTTVVVVIVDNDDDSAPSTVYFYPHERCVNHVHTNTNIHKTRAYAFEPFLCGCVGVCLILIIATGVNFVLHVTIEVSLRRVHPSCERKQIYDRCVIRSTEIWT